MSIHKSLRTGAGAGRGRNVLTRWERLAKLKDQGRWEDGDSVFGLAKVRNLKVKVGGKKKKKKEEEAAAEGAEGAAAEAPKA